MQARPLTKNSSFWAICLIILMTLANVVIALNAGLTIDEAHYSLYGQHLDWSYYDHPPMVGWIQALVAKLGHYELWVRLPSLLINLLNIGSIYWISRQFFGTLHSKIKLNSVFLYISAPLLCALGIVFLPKVPVLLLSLWTAYFLWLTTQNQTSWPWLALGLSLGLAGLSEYASILLALGVFIFLVWKRPRSFLTRGPYLTSLLALILVMPVVLWNYHHHWISILYQMNHGYGEKTWKLSLFTQGIVVQFLAYGPALFIFGLVGLRKAWKKWQDSASQILFCLSLPTLLVFIYSGGYQHLHLHWTANAWLLIIPLAARYVTENIQNSWVKKLRILAFVLIGLVYLVAFAALANLKGLLVLPTKNNKTLLQEVEGMSAAAAEVKKLSAQMHNPQPELFVNNWSLASRLAWYTNLPVQVAALGKATQFDLWYGIPDSHSNGILVVPRGWKLPATESHNSGEFAHCRKLSSLTVQAGKHPFDQFYFYHCWDFKKN